MTPCGSESPKAALAAGPTDGINMLDSAGDLAHDAACAPLGVWKPISNPRPRRRLRIVLMAYFDESGKWKSQDFICLSGFISEDSRLEALCNTWRKLLEKYQIPILHTTDLMTSPPQPPYDAEAWTAERKRQAIDDFATTVGKHILRGVSVGVDTRAYRAMPKQARDSIGDPAMFCFARVIRRIVDSLEEWQWDEPIGSIFDDVEHGAMKCYSLYREIKRHDPRAKRLLPTITFADDQVMFPLQAADLIAYATMREQRRGKAAWDERSWFRSLLFASRDDPVYGREYVSEYWDAEGLKLADRSNVTSIVDSPIPPEISDDSSTSAPASGG